MEQDGTRHTDAARGRLARIFSFLEALHQHRSPVVRRTTDQPWLLPLDRLPEHPSIRIGRHEDRAPDAAESAEHDPEFVLKVSRPVLTPPPPVPEILADWLPLEDKGWDDPFQEAEFIGTISWDEEDGGTTEEDFEDSPGRVRAFERWSRERERWAEKEAPARKAYWVYEQLYELHGILERESERVELVLGDGVLRWTRATSVEPRRGEGGNEEETIEHPILLAKAQLMFDPSVPEFTVTDLGAEVEIYAALLRSIPDVEGPTISKLQEDLEKGFHHPLGGTLTTEFLRRIAVRLSRHGEVADAASSGHGRGTGGAKPGKEDDEPRISRAGVLFLRRREQGFGAAIESVRRDVETREDVPVSLLQIVGLAPPPDLEEEEAGPPAWREPRDILLSKPANPEQLRIARALEKKGAVLVQGPPGTGKSHTIANLIGHVVARGESVLVTAHTTKALRVLRHHLVGPLRPLCVSVLERDSESRKQLEAAVAAIAEKVSTSSIGQLEESAEALARERAVILDELDRRRQDLCAAVASEYESIVVDGREYSPIEAARTVERSEATDGWIPGDVERGAALALSPAEAAEFYETNGKLAPEDEAELAGDLPAADGLPSPQEFAEILARRESPAPADRPQEDKTEGVKYWGAGPAERPDRQASERAEEDVRRLEGLRDILADGLAELSGESQWRLSIIEAGYKGGVHREPWDALVGQLREYCREAAGARNLLLEHDPSLKRTGLPLEDLLATAGEIVRHLESGGALGWFTGLAHPAWRYLIRHARVADGRPHRADQFKAVRSLIKVRMLLDRLKGRWDRQVASIGGPSSEDFVEPQEAFGIFADQIEALLSWRQKVEEIKAGLEAHGFDWGRYSEDQQQGHTSIIAGSQFADLVRLRETLLSPLVKMIERRLTMLGRRAVEAELEDLHSALRAKTSIHPAAVTCGLASAVRDSDPQRYESSLRRLHALERIRRVLDRRGELLAKLEGAAPGWAAAVRGREGVHGQAEVPGDVVRAWAWKQIAGELDSRHEVPIDDIRKDAEDLAQRLRRTTVELIGTRAWAHQIRRTREHPGQRQALVGWLDTIRRIGAGTGKRVPRLARRLREQMAECRGAVPIWVVPLARLPENFDLRRTRFDVVIVDEASQSDVMALLALWIAKKVVIVGDHEQVSPTAVGLDVDTVQKLIDEHLSSKGAGEGHPEGIPNSHLYDGRMSIYDLARQSFGDTICLLEHFRCPPDIIGFSNMLSYDRRIKPLREPDESGLRPSVIASRVPGGASKGKVNEKEARTVAALIAAAVEQPEYAGKTIGAISMVGEEQALLIERLIHQRLEPREIEGRRIISGNPAQFQGDERDVILLSMVDSAPDGKPLPRRTEDMYRQRFNVAASRAKDQMWVVHSLDPARDLKEGDLRRTLIEYAENPAAFGAETAGDEDRAASKLEKDVAEKLREAGYGTRLGFRVGYCRIGVVVCGPAGRRLAVECEGDRYRGARKIAKEIGEAMGRQATLERLGWKFVRVRGSQFYHDPERAMAPVFARLSELGVARAEVRAGGGRDSAPPGGTGSRAEGEGPGEEPKEEELKERVLKRAEELLAQWTERKGPAPKK